MPTSDYLAMGTPFPGSTARISRLEYMENMLKRMTQNSGFQIRGLAYCDAARNAAAGINKNRYILYRSDPDVLTMNIPIDFRQLQPPSPNGLHFNQPAYGQYSGCLIVRKREVLYFDETAASS